VSNSSVRFWPILSRTNIDFNRDGSDNLRTISCSLTPALSLPSRKDTEC
jgi:hypothetical protein